MNDVTIVDPVVFTEGLPLIPLIITLLAVSFPVEAPVVGRQRAIYLTPSLVPLLKLFEKGSVFHCLANFSISSCGEKRQRDHLGLH